MSVLSHILHLYTPRGYFLIISLREFVQRNTQTTQVYWEVTARSPYIFCRSSSSPGSSNLFRVCSARVVLCILTTLWMLHVVLSLVCFPPLSLPSPPLPSPPLSSPSPLLPHVNYCTSYCKDVIWVNSVSLSSTLNQSIGHLSERPLPSSSSSSSSSSRLPHPHRHLPSLSSTLPHPLPHPLCIITRSAVY